MVNGLSFLESESGLWPPCLAEGGGLFKTNIVTDQDITSLGLKSFLVFVDSVEGLSLTLNSKSNICPFSTVFFW